MKCFDLSVINAALFGIALSVLLAGSDADADFKFGTPENLGPLVNSPFEDAAQSISADGLTLYISSDRPGGAGDWDIWVTSRPTLHDDWGAAQNLGAPVNTAYLETSPCLSDDGLSLFFSDGVWHLYNPRPGGFGKCDLWVSTRPTQDGEWSEAANLGPAVNTAAHECDPSLSADGLALYFDSDRTGGSGSVDLWASSRAAATDPWQDPVNLGPSVNSPAVDAFPWISADGLRLFFMSDRTGDFDLYVAARRAVSDRWEPAVNLGREVNSSDVEACPSLSADGTTLFFMSMRSPKIGGVRDLWQVPLTPIIDFSADGKIGIEDLLRLIECWGQNEPSVDVGPMPWGDGTVDAEDLEVLMDSWGQDIPDPTLVAHWRLDELDGIVASDSAGDNDGTLYGDPLWQPAGGKVQGALQFDGIDDSISTPFVLNPADGEFSVFAWIQGGAAGQVVLSQISGVDWLSADPGGGKLMTNLSRPAGGRIAPPPLASEFVITDGDWHRIGFVWDGSNRILYADNVEVARDTQAGLEGSAGGLYIGAGKALDAGSHFCGLIDDVRIYNRAVRP